VDDGVVVTVLSGEMEADVVCGPLRSIGIECGHRVSEAASLIAGCDEQLLDHDRLIPAAV
jgi:hypothetical protein